MPYDNGEIGPTIWFADNINDYAKGNDFVLYYDLKLSENGITKNKYGIVYDGQNGYASKQIPFNDLGVLRIPVAEKYGNFTPNTDFLKGGVFKLVPENTEDYIIYVDLFNKFVQPYINEKNYINRFSQNNDLKYLF
jgi:hypothetical protein